MDVLAKLVEDYIEESQVDYVGLWQVAAAARRRFGARTTGEVRKLSLKVVHRLYKRGLRPGNYWGEDFDYWPDEGCQVVLDRIEREWIKADADPNLAEPICWFARKRQ